MALAVQNILGDLLAAISIVTDKPFVVGDFITVGDFQGKVENIGMKTTRLRGAGGEQIIFGNDDLLKSRIRNNQRMEERPITFRFGVPYNTSPEKLAAIPGMVKEIVESQQNIRFDRTHLVNLGESCLEYEVAYVVTTPDFTTHMNLRQAVNLG